MIYCTDQNAPNWTDLGRRKSNVLYQQGTGASVSYIGNDDYDDAFVAIIMW